MAGIVGAEGFGVHRRTRLVDVRVVGADGQGRVDVILAGLDYALGEGRGRGGGGLEMHASVSTALMSLCVCIGMTAREAHGCSGGAGPPECSGVHESGRTALSGPQTCSVPH